MQFGEILGDVEYQILAFLLLVKENNAPTCRSDADEPKAWKGIRRRRFSNDERLFSERARATQSQLKMIAKIRSVWRIDYHNQIKSLALRASCLSVMPTHVALSLESCETLHLQLETNEIKSRVAKVLKAFPAVRRLHLYERYSDDRELFVLKDIGMILFPAAGALYSLDLRNCQALCFGTEMPSFLRSLSSTLRELHLGTSCRRVVHSLPSWFAQLQLKSFQAHDVSLDHFVAPIQAMLGLESLALTFSTATHIFENRSDHLVDILKYKDKLTRLDLTGWNLQSFPTSILLAPEKRKYAALRTLTLASWHRLISLPKNFPDMMPNLKTLDLSYTSLRTLPDSFDHMHSLRHLIVDCHISVDRIERLAQAQPKLLFSAAESLRLLDEPYWSSSSRPRRTFADFLEESNDENQRNALSPPHFIKTDEHTLKARALSRRGRRLPSSSTSTLLRQ